MSDRLNLGIYLVTDPVLCAARGVEETVRAAVGGGVRYVQLRDKKADDETVLRQLERLATLIAGRATLLVNDRLDVVVRAREVGLPVDGVHLGQSDTSPHIARERLGSDAIIGLTANAPQHLTALTCWPLGTVDYLGVGVIHPTSTKPDHPPVLGVPGFARFTKQSPLPTVAIGGVNLSDLPELRRVGAAGAAVVSAICASDDPAAAARSLVEAWQSASDS